MKYEDWCKHSKEILAEADEVNKWREAALEDCMTVLGSRIFALTKTAHAGCGFSYEKVRTLGHLIRELAIGWHPSANWCANVKKDRIRWIALQVIYNQLVESVSQAEKS